MGLFCSEVCRKYEYMCVNTRHSVSPNHPYTIVTRLKSIMILELMNGAGAEGMYPAPCLVAV